MNPKRFKYDLHVHTNQASACGASTGAEQAIAYKKAGYAGIVITDHFFNGNSCVDRSLPWMERVTAYCSGYEDAKYVGDMIDLDVFFGIEWNLNGMEFLLYGLTPEWLYEHENLDQYTLPRLFQAVSEAGGAMIQAHPYREDWYIKQIILYPGMVHGIEGVNLGNLKRNPVYNDRALALGRRSGLPMTCGSDSHHKDGAKCGMLLERRVQTPEELVEEILCKRDQSGDDWYTCDLSPEGIL